MVRVGILGIWVTSSILRVLLSGFWVSGLQFPSPRDLFPGSWVSGSHFTESQFQGPVSQGPSSRSPGSHCPRFQGPRIPGLRSQGPRVPGPGSQVLILDYAQQIHQNDVHVEKTFSLLNCYSFKKFQVFCRIFKTEITD